MDTLSPPVIGQNGEDLVSVYDTQCPLAMACLFSGFFKSADYKHYCLSSRLQIAEAADEVLSPYHNGIRAEKKWLAQMENKVFTQPRVKEDLPSPDLNRMLESALVSQILCPYGLTNQFTPLQLQFGFGQVCSTAVK